MLSQISLLKADLQLFSRILRRILYLEVVYHRVDDIFLSLFSFLLVPFTLNFGSKLLLVNVIFTKKKILISLCTLK